MGEHGHMYIYICMAETLCYSPETTTTSLTGYSPVQNKKSGKKRVIQDPCCLLGGLLPSIYFFLATPSGLWDLSSLPRTCTHAPCSGREVLPFTNIHKETDVGKHILLYLVFLWIAEVSAVG